MREIRGLCIVRSIETKTVARMGSRIAIEKWRTGRGRHAGARRESLGPDVNPLEGDRNGQCSAACSTGGKTGKGGGGGKLPARGFVGGPGGARNHRLVRDTSWSIDVRYLRRLSGRCRAAGASVRPCRGGIDGESLRASRAAARYRAGRRPCGEAAAVDANCMATSNPESNAGVLNHRVEISPHAVDARDVLRTLRVDLWRGLSHEEVAERRARHGSNVLRSIRRRAAWRILLDQFRSLIVGL